VATMAWAAHNAPVSMMRLPRQSQLKAMRQSQLKTQHQSRLKL